LARGCPGLTGLADENGGQSERAGVDRCRAAWRCGCALGARDRGAVARLPLRAQDVPSAGDAEDVLQDTLLAAARTFGNYRGDASVSTWLYTIARSFCIKRRRRSKFAPEALLPLDSDAAIEAPAAERAPDDALAERELASALNKAVAGWRRHIAKCWYCETSRACQRRRSRR